MTQSAGHAGKERKLLGKMPSSTLFFPPNFLVVVIVAPAFPPGSDIPYILFKSITDDDEQRLHIFRLVAAIVWRREETPLPSRSDTYRSSTLVVVVVCYLRQIHTTVVRHNLSVSATGKETEDGLIASVTRQ